MRRAPLLLGALFLVAIPATAADKTPLAALKESPAAIASPTGGKTTTIPGLALEARPPYTRQEWLAKAATKDGYCIVSMNSTMQLNETSWSPAGDGQELWRVVTKEDKTTLERTTFGVDVPNRTVSLVRRVSVELREVARSPEGVVVWSFRLGPEVIVIATGAYSGTEEAKKTEDGDGSLPFMSSDCKFGAIRLDARRANVGVVGQLSGSLATEGKEGPTFIVYASISRVGRDPEPRLAVRVRMNKP